MVQTDPFLCLPTQSTRYPSLQGTLRGSHDADKERKVPGELAEKSGNLTLDVKNNHGSPVKKNASNLPKHLFKMPNANLISRHYHTLCHIT